MATVLTPNPSISGWRMSSWTFSVVGLTFTTFDVCEGAVPPWPAASSVPSGAHRRLSRRKPTETLSLLTGVCPRDKRMKDWLPHPPMYSHLPSFEISRPFGPANSLPGTIFQPVLVCHSQTSPLVSPVIIRARAPAASLPRGEKFVVINPPSARPTTEFKPIGSGATAHPIQVNVGALGRASNSKTSIDSLSP